MPQVYRTEKKVIIFKPEEFLTQLGYGGFTIEQINFTSSPIDPYVQVIIWKDLNKKE